MVIESENDIMESHSHSSLFILGKRQGSSLWKFPSLRQTWAAKFVLMENNTDILWKIIHKNGDGFHC